MLRWIQGHPWLLQANSGKVQSFSKFQAELRAQHKQSKGGRHKHKRDRQHHSDKPDTPKAAPPAAGNNADNTQVSWMAASEVMLSACFAHVLWRLHVRFWCVLAHCVCKSKVCLAASATCWRSGCICHPLPETAVRSLLHDAAVLQLHTCVTMPLRQHSSA